MSELIAAVNFPIANYLIDHCFNRTSRPVVVIGAIIGLSLLYFCVQLHVNPYMFILMYTTGSGIIKGFYKQCSLVAGWSHLGGRKGFVSGLILSGYGLGGSIFSIYYNKRVDALGENPKLDKSDGQMYFPEVVGQRYPRIHKEVCIGMVIFTLLAVVLLSNYQPKKVDVVQEDSSYLKNSFIDMSPAKRERLGILL